MPPANDEDIEITEAEISAMREDAENDGAYEQPSGPLKFHYGDGTIVDAGTMIHDDCGGIISIIDDGMVCECGANADLPAPTPSDETLQPFRDALVQEQQVEPEIVGFLAATCVDRHISNCECRGVARGPRP